MSSKDPSKKQSWNAIEDYIFFETHKIVGNKWSAINKFLQNKYFTLFI